MINPGPARSAVRNRAASLVLALLAAAGALVACDRGPSSAASDPDRIRVVASLYPLAWVARQVGGPNVSVVDLTPPGVAARGSSLSDGQRTELETAKLVVILGNFGFQPEVESAASEANGKVVSVTTGMKLSSSTEQGLGNDPYVWLDPVLMRSIVREVTDGLESVDPSHAAAYRRRGTETASRVSALADSYGTAFERCRFDTFVTTRAMFGYLADEYGLHQYGLEGYPDAQATDARLQAAADAIRSGKVAPAVFYEDVDEGERIAQSLSSEVGAPAHLLGTLESEPREGDYLSIMRSNLEQLRVGLRCP